MTIVCIDAGHGGPDPGAVGNGLHESSLAAQIAAGVAQRLSEYICKVEMVPRSDDLNKRAKFANDLKADLFLSLHINAGGGTGFESYRHKSTTIRTAEIHKIIHGAVMDYLMALGIKDRGRKQAAFAVLGKTEMSAVLLECLFIDNPEDTKYLKSNAFLDGLANEIAWGVVCAFSLQRKVEPAAEVTIMVNGQPFPAIMQGDVAYGPVRGICEALGHKVDWHDATRAVTIHG